jgi:hypothetical protein
MAKALPFYVQCNAEQIPSHDIQETIVNTLREQHGIHGARLAPENQSIDIGSGLPSVYLSQADDGRNVLFYDDHEGKPHLDAVTDEQLLFGISRVVMNTFALKPERQSSRRDSHELIAFSGDRPPLNVDPSKWIFGNPLIADLARQSPKYGNVIRYVCNERGLFLKVGNSPGQRAYWNSTTNAGLPVIKKADPTHEGTFMLHDLYHFVPTDPILGEGGYTAAKQSTYLAHRMMSEACTLVLADMVAVADAGLESQGYDIARRRIYPVYRSIVESQGAMLDIDKLLAANTYFCFTGDTKGFELLGASAKSLQDYRQKYEAVFHDDFIWNQQNIVAMAAEAASNPRMADYQSWLQNVGGFPSLANYDAQHAVGEEVDIAEMLRNFKAQFKRAATYSEPLDELSRQRLASRKFLAGQRIVFARYAPILQSKAYADVFDGCFSLLDKQVSTDSLDVVVQEANSVVDSYMRRISEQGVLLPHEVEEARFAAPLYPVRFVNYERKKQEDNFVASMRDFTRTNHDALSMLLDSI